MNSQSSGSRNWTRRTKFAVAGAAIVALGALGTLSQGTDGWIETLKSTTHLTSPAYAAPMELPAISNPSAIADVVERVGPAVVTIHVKQTAEAGREMGIPQGTPFDEFFRRFFEGDPNFRGLPNAPAPRQRRVEGLGSGFIIDKSGKIVTNNHVVEGADEITVELSDGRKMKATLVGRDEKTDLALLKVEAKSDLPTIAFGDSDPVRVGEWIVAMGNPFGVGQTATAGIVSAHHRNIGAGPYDDFLQLDAPINRGNSGGPTVNLKGEVIGVNTAIFSPSGGSVGIGFAIPSNLAKQIIADLADDGRVDRGWLGVQIQEVTPEIAQSLNLKEAKGALVAKVEPGSPAADAKLEAGDLIVALDGKAVKGVRDLPRMVANIEAGKTTRLGVVRDGKERSLSVKIGKMPPSDQVARANADSGSVAGLELGALDARTRDRLGVKDGVAITGVRPGSAAEETGLSRGDVIVAVGNKSVSSPEDVVEQIAAAEKAKASSILLRIVNPRGALFVALPLDEA